MRVSVKADQVIKDFPAGDDMIRVLFGIDLEIYFGQLTMLIGPSGCGKTTLISILTGILSPTSGEIQAVDHNIKTLSDRDKVIFRRKNVGFIFQQYNLLPALTAAENAATPLIAAGMPFDAAVSKAREVLADVGMKGQADKLPKQLSGGQQQRVAIARALVHQPKLIVCDEPTASLDAKTGHHVMEILREIANDQNRAVLVVTHDNRVYHFSDRIVAMTDGRIVGDYKTEDFIKQGLE